MKSTMLQNPSDPEATFRNKAGKEHRGYAANLEESVGADGSVVTEYQYEQTTIVTVSLSRSTLRRWITRKNGLL